MDHGFTIFRIVCLVLAILLAWGLRWGYLIVPQIRATADKVVKIQDLQNVDIRPRLYPCGFIGHL
jgi:hypothetical protein